MDGNVSRRTALGVLSAAGAVTALAGCSSSAQARLEPPFSTDPGLTAPVAEPAPTPPTTGGRAGVRGRMSGALAAVEALMLENTRCVFGIPGAQNNEFWDAMKSKRLPYLLATNEMSVSVMADGAARATGEPGVFAVVPGPGLTNAMTGIGEAFLDSVPLVGLVTDIDRSGDGKAFQVHSLAGAAMVRPISKIVLEARNLGQIPDLIHQAFQVARSGEPGPAIVIIPFTFYNKTWDYDETIPPAPTPAFDEAAYSKAVALLSNKRTKVGIYAGMGSFPATAELRSVAETLQAPVATSVSGKGALSDSHPLAVGWGYGAFGTQTAEKVFKNVDLVLAVGVRYSEVSTANYSIPKHDQVIHVDANADNIGRNVKTTAGVHADSQVFLSRLMNDADAIRRPNYPALWNQIARSRAEDRAGYNRPCVTAAVDPMTLLYRIRQKAGCEALIFVDVTASTHFASESIDVITPRRYFTPADNQSMGWTIAASIGAQQVCRDRHVISVVGDGCFLMSAIEMSTAAREHLPVKFFVLDDGTYHYMQMLQKPVYRRTTATELAKIDYQAFAKAMGLGYLHITSNDQIDAGLTSAISYQGPLLTHVTISYDGRELRWLTALKASYIDHLDTSQKIRMASRVAVRVANPIKVND